jgi:hypothetical protein
MTGYAFDLFLTWDQKNEKEIVAATNRLGDNRLGCPLSTARARRVAMLRSPYFAPSFSKNKQMVSIP